MWGLTNKNKYNRLSIENKRKYFEKHQSRKSLEKGGIIMKECPMLSPTPSLWNEKLQMVLTIFYTYSGILWLLFALEFIKIGSISPVSALVRFYEVILTSFIGQKEYSRWFLGIHTNRKGELFTYLWCFTFLVMGIIASVLPGKFQVSSQLTEVCIVVFILFISTECSKIGYKIRHEGEKENKT
ncbi:MAG: hypothetical protein COX43_02975 [Parcubacteria group bacterium CG23_combo_of_CG06-09_8_20_14_all_35_9]|nr:MAG: hypothetical protein COX43_02975 [Parcubacteria group bacterium CG23_combo_of_CG06-09_8_20_14_all_35_9]